MNGVTIVFNCQFQSSADLVIGCDRTAWLSAVTRQTFQSSADLVIGCDVAITSHKMQLMFQSSADLVIGCDCQFQIGNVPG